MESAGIPRAGDVENGGWAQIKAKMDALTASAAAQNIETIRLDAGDFIEGTMLYFPNHGRDVFRAYLQMGYDASALGNHDWLMGATGLNTLFGEMTELGLLTPKNHPILSANIELGPRMNHLRAQMKPYTIIERAGVKIGVMGLSTTEAFYKWIPKIRSRKSDFKLKDYLDSKRTIVDDETGEERTEYVPGIANKTIRALKHRVDAVVALTHIGFDEDLELVQGTRNLDLVVGGHSHTFLETLSAAFDRDGNSVPVVQTGYSGHSIGRVLIDVEKGKKAKVLSYELIDVPTDGRKDPVVATSVKTAQDEFRKMYGPEYLDKEIGKSEVRLVSGKFGPTAFGKFSVDAIRESLDADVGIDVGAFHSEKPQSAGVVTRQTLMDMYPRKFEADQAQGLSVYRARIPGFVIALGIKFATKYGLFVSFSGVDYKPTKLTETEYAKEYKKATESKRDMMGRYRAKDITVNGNKVCLLCTYNVAAPESLIRGAYGISFLTRLVIWGGKRSEKTIWDAFEEHLSKIKVIRRLGNDERYNPRRYTDSYQRKWIDKVDAEQVLEEGGQPASAAELDHDGVSTSKLYEMFLKDVMRVKALKINNQTDIDSLDAEI